MQTGDPSILCPPVQTWMRFPHSSCRGMTKKETSEKLKRGEDPGGAVGEGTIAPSGTW